MAAHKVGNIGNLGNHAHSLGTVFANLQSLEFQLRLFLYKKRSKPHIFFCRGQNLTGISVGTVLPENAVTDYDSLGDLIKRYNALAKRKFPSFEIDHNLVALRDALAHGRVFVPKTGLPLQLLKFTKPNRGKVRVKFAADLTQAWFATQNAQVLQAISKIQSANHATRRK